ncbi:MAG: response regulator [Thermoanaerobaculia bacterium]
MSGPPVVHVVDDDASFRAAVARLVRAGGWEAVEDGSTGDFLLHRPPDRPGCVLLDLQMPGGPSGLDLQEALSGLGIALPVVFVTGHADVPSSVQAMKAGAVDYLTKPVEREALFDALRRAFARDARSRGERAEADALRDRFDTLSAREREVLRRVAEGKLNKQVAGEMRIAERTVKLHRATALRKLGARSAAELGRLAERLRRLSAGDDDAR